MGDEKDENGNGDGYLNLLSRYVLDTSVYSEGSTINLWWNNSATYENTTAQLWLNRKFYNSFNTGENNIIPFVTVDRTGYSINDNYYEGTTPISSVSNQKIYLPWGTKYTR